MNALLIIVLVFWSVPLALGVAIAIACFVPGLRRWAREQLVGPSEASARHTRSWALGEAQPVNPARTDTLELTGEMALANAGVR